MGSSDKQVEMHFTLRLHDQQNASRTLSKSTLPQPPAFVVALLLLPKRSLVLVGKLGATSPSLQHSREGPRRLRPSRSPPPWFFAKTTTRAAGASKWLELAADQWTSGTA